MKLSKFYRLLSILLFFLTKLSNCLEYPKCEQREAYMKKKFPNTLIIFVNYFSSSNDTNAKIRYVLKQVACSIPKNLQIEYGTISKNEFTSHTDISKVVDWLEKSVEVQSCQTTFSSLMDALNSYKSHHERVEIIFHVPTVSPTEKCDYIGEFQKLPTVVHFNLIRFDNITNFGTKTMNFPNIMSINSSQPEASSELKEKAMKFVNEILEIAPEIAKTSEESPKECTDPDYLLYSISSGVISLVLVFLVKFSIYAVNFGYFRLLKKNKKVEKTVEPIAKPDKTMVPVEEKDQKFHDDDLGEISAATRKTRNFDDTYRASGTVRKVAPKDFDESYKH